MDRKENRQRERLERAERRPRRGIVVQRYMCFAGPAEEQLQPVDSNAVLVAAAAAAGGEEAAKGGVQ